MRPNPRGNFKAIVIVAAGVHAAGISAYAAESPHVMITELRYPAWQALQAEQSLGQAFPLLVHYDHTGKCIRRETPGLTFSAQDLDALRPEQPPCPLTWQASPWADVPPPAVHTARLFVLDIPFCTGCTQAERVLREWVEDQPNERYLHLVRVIPSSKAEMPKPAAATPASSLP